LTLLSLLVNYLIALDNDSPCILTRAYKVKDDSLSNFEDCSRVVFEIILLRWMQFMDSHNVGYIQHDVANRARTLSKKKFNQIINITNKLNNKKKLEVFLCLFYIKSESPVFAKKICELSDLVDDVFIADDLSVQLISYSKIIMNREVGGMTASQFYSNIDLIKMNGNKYNCRIWVNKNLVTSINENLTVFIGCSSTDSAVFSNKMNNYALCIAIPGLNFDLIREENIKHIKEFIIDCINKNFKISIAKYILKLVIGVGFVDKIKLLGSPYEVDRSLANRKFNKIYRSNLRLMKQFPFLKICNSSLPLPPVFFNNLLSVNGVHKMYDSNLNIVKCFKDVMLEMPNFKENPYRNFNKDDFLVEDYMVHNREIHLELNDNLVKYF
jgi:hypothetical protein